MHLSDEEWTEKPINHLKSLRFIFEFLYRLILSCARTLIVIAHQLKETLRQSKEVFLPTNYLVIMRLALIRVIVDDLMAAHDHLDTVKIFQNQGRSYRGFGGFGRTPPRAGKGPQKSVFAFFFFFWAGSHSIALSLKRAKGRHQQKTCHARRGMARWTFEWHFAQPPSPPKKTSLWPTCKTRRGQVRMPNAVLSVEPSISTASVQQHRLIKERPGCHHVQLKVVETTMGRKEQRERERKKAAKGSYALSGFGFLPKKRSWSDDDLNATATSQRQLVEEDSSSRSSHQLQEQDEGSSLQSSSATQVSVKL